MTKAVQCVAAELIDDCEMQIQPPAFADIRHARGLYVPPQGCPSTVTFSF
jgi:hypothetical protein